MKRYIQHLKAKQPHEKRRVAMQASAVITGAIFLVWLGTLGPRIAAQVAPSDTQTASVAQAGSSADQGQQSNAGLGVGGVLASVGAALSGQWNQTKTMLVSVGSGPSWNGEATSSVGTAVVQPSSAPATVIAVPDSVPSDDATDTSTTNL